MGQHPESAYVFPAPAYERVSYVRVRCSAGCGVYLGRTSKGWARSPVGQAERFRTQDEAWQAARAALWADVPLLGHLPHEHGPYGPGRHWYRCNGGALRCDEVRSYRDATVCTKCRDEGWMP